MTKSLLIALLSFCLTSCLANYCNGQQLKLGNNPTQTNKSALLELESWNQGLRLTRVDTTAVNRVIGTLSPAQQDSTNGMIVYQISDSCLYYRSGGIWHRLMVSDSLGIVSLNGDKTRSQTLALTKNSGSLGISNSLSGSHILNIPLASNTDTGLITPNAQTINGTKTLLRSPIISTLHVGAVLFMGTNDSLDGDADNLYWDNNSKMLGLGTAPHNTLEIKSKAANTSGLTLSNLTSSTSVTDLSAEAIGVRNTGEITRVNTAPTYYNHAGTIISPQVKKIVVDSLTMTSPNVSEVQTIDISALGFTKILNIQLTGRIIINTNDNIYYSIIPSVLDYTLSQVRIRVLELQIGNSSLLGSVVGNLAGNSFQVPSKGGFLGLSQTNDPKPYTIYYQIDGY